MNKAVEVLKKNSDLKQKAELIKNNELLTDYLEQWEIENRTQKAEVRAEQLELNLDVGTKNVGPLKPAKPLSKLQARKKETQKLKAEAKKKKTQETKSTEIDLDRDMPSPESSLSVKKNKIKKEAKKIEEKVAEVSKKIKQNKSRKNKTQRCCNRTC
jgi:hypothetical protein